MNGYIGFYKGKKFEIYANTSYEAQKKIAIEQKIKKSYDITIVLAEKDGGTETHVADF